MAYAGCMIDLSPYPTIDDLINGNGNGNGAEPVAVASSTSSSQPHGSVQPLKWCAIAPLPHLSVDHHPVTTASGTTIRYPFTFKPVLVPSHCIQ
jgi:hypothetical protein